MLNAQMTLNSDGREQEPPNGTEVNIITSLSKFGQAGEELSHPNHADAFHTFSAVVSKDQLKTQDARITVQMNNMRAMNNAAGVLSADDGLRD